MRRFGLMTIAVALVSSGCGDTRPASQEAFFAVDSDFATYASWPSVPLVIATAVDDGPTVSPPLGFLNRPAEAGANAYAVGTIIVKLVPTSDDPLTWPAFAMVKRGGDYNSGGAKNWEFFVLGFSPTGAPTTIARGENPPDDGVSTHGYGEPDEEVTCNRCHAAGDAPTYDAILSPSLRLQAK